MKDWLRFKKVAEFELPGLAKGSAGATFRSPWTIHLIKTRTGAGRRTAGKG